MHSWERFRRTVRGQGQKNAVNLLRTDEHHAPATPIRRTGKNKKNAFFMYMEARRSEMQASGRRFTRGFAEVSDLVSDDWKKLTPEEKAVYEEKARNYNGITAVEKEQVSTHKMKKTLPNEGPEEYYVRIELETWKQELEENRKVNRDIVWRMFESKEWPTERIVVCNVTLYFQPDARIAPQEYIPAEIGLTAFSLMDGVVDNFARLIDPGDDIPLGCGGEVEVNLEKMGLPKLGRCAELLQYETLLTQMECFLGEYAGNSEDGYCVFALNSELEMVTRSMEWICEVAGRSIRFKVLSLSRWAHLASTSNPASKVLRQLPNVDPFVYSVRPQRRESLKMVDFAALSSELKFGFCRFGEPAFTSSFYYANDHLHRLLIYGIFSDEGSIDTILETTFNYKYHEQLCCMYHMKKTERTEWCALTTSNRYVFYILEILTRSNYVKNIRRGFHYPVVEKCDLHEERKRRFEMLNRWGVTEMELELKEETPKERFARENGETERTFKDRFRSRNFNGVQKGAANVHRGNSNQNVGRNGAQLGKQRASYDGGVGNLPGSFREMALYNK